MLFFTNSLLSKWGFHDGDQIDDLVYDFFDQFDNNNPLQFEDVGKIDLHKLLFDVVKKHVIPKIDQDVEIYFIGTSHNPVRAEKINGKEFSNYFDPGPKDLLTPESVEVPDDVILAEVMLQLNQK